MLRLSFYRLSSRIFPLPNEVNITVVPVVVAKDLLICTKYWILALGQSPAVLFTL